MASNSFNKPSDRSWFARVFVNRDVFCLWSGQIVSQTGDSMFRIGMLWMLLDLTGSNALTGLIAMAAYLPSLVFGIYSGVLVDRFDRRRTMLLADVARALIVGALPVLYLTGGLNALVLGVAAFATASFNTLFLPARDTLVGELAGPEDRLRANAMIQTSWQYATLVGPAIAGAVLWLGRPHHLFGLDAATYLVSFGFIVRIRSGGTAFRRPKARQLMGNLLGGWGDMKSGLAYVRKSRRIWVLLLVTAVDNLFLMGPAVLGPPIFVRQVLGLGAESYAMLHVATALGMIAGTGLLHRYGSRWRNGHIVLWGIILDGITFVPILWIDTFWAMFAMLAVHAMAIPMIIVSRPTIIQNTVPREMQGRVFSMISVAVFGFTAISTAATGWLAEHVSIQVIYAVCGGLAAASGAVGWLFADFRRLH